MDDLISRQAAIDELKKGRALFCDNTPESFSRLSYGDKCRVDEVDNAIAVLVNLPSAQPTLYGYRIEHLAYIARVMEKEGVTAEKAVRTFDDAERMVEMILKEAEEAVYEKMYSKFLRFEPYKRTWNDR